MRRHLGYTPLEVDEMPWWEVRMWAEGLIEEFPAEDEPEKSESGSPLRDVSYDVSPAVVESSLDELSGLGMRVRKVS